MDLIHRVEIFCQLIIFFSVAVIVFDPIVKKMISERVKRQTSSLKKEKTALNHETVAPASPTTARAPMIGQPMKEQSPLYKAPWQRKKDLLTTLVESGFISQETLNKALEHQNQNGGGVIPYLLHHGFIQEKQLVQCYCSQFGIPYLPLASYTITRDTIKLIPTDIVEKYWILPIEKNGDLLTVVMIDPLDAKVIQEAEEVTGLKIIPFVGVISEIFSALHANYKHFKVDDPSHIPSFVVNTNAYFGKERRASIRYATTIDVRFPVDKEYVQTQTLDISRHGFAFRFDRLLPLGMKLPLEIHLPQDFYALPILALTEVVRCVARENNTFEIGVKTLKIVKQDINTIIEFAVDQLEKEVG